MGIDQNPDAGDAGPPDMGADGGAPDIGDMGEMLPDIGPPDMGPADIGADCGGADQTCCENNTCQAGFTCRDDRCLCLAQLSSGEHQTCAIFADGAAQCVGSNLFGQIGDGLVGGNRPMPTPVLLPGPAQSLVNGAFHTCARLASGVYCWGSNRESQLGLGPSVMGDVPSPILVASAPSNVLQLALGSFHSCARAQDNTLSCWGENEYTQIGLDAPVPRPNVELPTQVPGLPAGTLQDVTTGAFHTCAVVDGSVWCWGFNVQAQLGVGETFTSTPTPSEVIGLDQVIDIAAGDWHTCALRSDGDLWCWGRNSSGQLGRGVSGTPGLTAMPILGTGLTLPIRSFATMDDHTCAIDADQQLFCWGDNSRGQIGQRTSGPPQPTPVAVQGLGTVLDVAGGRRHTCTTTTEGAIFCFGDNGFGELANGGYARTGTPTPSLFACP